MSFFFVFFRFQLFRSAQPLFSVSAGLAFFADILRLVFFDRGFSFKTTHLLTFENEFRLLYLPC